MSYIYPIGMDLFAFYATESFSALLVKTTYTYDATDIYVSDLSAHELLGTGYSRQSISMTMDLDSVTPEKQYLLSGTTSVNFGDIVAGETAGAVILYKNSSNVLMAYYPINAPTGQATDGTAFTVNFPNSLTAPGNGILAYLTQG